MDKPIIGVTPDFATVPTQLGPTDRLFLNLDYPLALDAVGAIPYVLPPILDPGDALDGIDGLLLTGGGDIDPHHYGASAVHPETYGISELRDTFELALVKAAIARDIPVLAICRGIQVLNVALGGTLIQHIPASDPKALNHRQHELGIPVDRPAHSVTIAPTSKLAAIVETTSLLVNSYHHQAIEEPAPGLIVTARAPDGVIEAVELPTASFVVGVQWHPERLFRTFPEHRALFHALVLAALHARTLRRSTRP